MTPRIPIEIFQLHRALLSALRVDYFPPGLGDVNAWRDFLFVFEPLKDSAGGPLSAKDIHAAVALMRLENRSAGNRWSLRFARILKEPESFRDLVLQSRKQNRDRPPAVPASRSAGNTSILIERDPSAENQPQPIAHHLRAFREKMEGPHAQPEKKKTDSA